MGKLSGKLCEDDLKNASYTALWQWVLQLHQESASSGVFCISTDVKVGTLSTGRVSRNPSGLYQWSVHGIKDHSIEDSQVILSIYQGLPDHLAIVPTELWSSSTSRIDRTALGTASSCLDILCARGPFWSNRLMIHKSRLGDAVRQLVLTSLEPTKRPYSPPGKNLILTGWDLRRDSLACLMAPDTRTSDVPSIRELVRAAGAAGDWIAEPNPMQPWLFDLYLSPKGTNTKIRWEVKEGRTIYGTLDGLLKTRRDPASERHPWHVFYSKHDSGHFCMTRDELDFYTSCSETDRAAFVANHTFDTLSEMLASLHAKRLDKAIDVVAQLLGSMTPKECGEHTSTWHVAPSSCPTWHNPLSPATPGGHPQHRPTPSNDLALFTALHLNYMLMEIEPGAVLIANKPGPNVVGTHNLCQHQWTSLEKDTFQQTGWPPISGWSDIVDEESPAIVLNLLNIAPPQAGTEPHARRGHHTQKRIPGLQSLTIAADVGEQEWTSSAEPIVYVYPTKYAETTLAKLPEGEGARFKPCKQNDLLEQSATSVPYSRPLEAIRPDLKPICLYALPVQRAAKQVAELLATDLQTFSFTIVDDDRYGTRPIELARLRKPLRELFQLQWDYRCTCTSQPRQTCY